VQAQIDVTDAEHCEDQEDPHYDHQNVRLARFGNVERQMMRRHWMKLISQWHLLVTHDTMAARASPESAITTKAA
jgi:hypothetical protein